MKMRTTLAASLLLAVGGTAQASETSDGTARSVHVMNNGVVLFNLAGTRTTTPACHTMAGRWAFDGNTPAGQAKLAFLLTAYSAQKPIIVYGTGACPDWSDTETVKYFRTAD